MKTYYEQLWEILNEVPEIKEDFFDNKSEVSDIIDNVMYLNDRITEVNSSDDIKDLEQKKDEIIKYIENESSKIEERHIRMYLLNNSIRNIHINPWWGIWILRDNSSNVITELDNSKPFHLQDEQVFKSLVEYFKSLL